MLAWPPDAKSGTRLKTRLNAEGTWQALAPIAVIEELMGVVLRVKRFLDAHFALVGASTLAFLIAIIWLSRRMRAPEFETLHKIGCSRSTVLRIQVAEWGLVFAFAALLAGVAIVAVIALAPEVSQL